MAASCKGTVITDASALTRTMKLSAVGISWKALLRNQSIRGAMMFAFSGLAFAVGNILLALKLPTQDYGKFALVIAVLVLSSSIAPFGLDQLLLRRNIRFSLSYLKPILLSSGLVASATCVFGYYAYGLPAIELGSLAMGTVTLAILRTVAGGVRRNGRSMVANIVDTSSDWALLIVAFIATSGLLVSGSAAILTYLALMAVITTASGMFLRRLERANTMKPERINYREAGSLLGIGAAGAALVQVERLIIPLLLSVQDLATFAVLASVAIAPFRVMGSGIVTSFAQQMRVLDSKRDRHKALWNEGRLFGGLTVAASLGVILVAPWAADILTAGKYQVGVMLALAACINGVGKVIQAVPRAIIVGTGSTSDLHAANLCIWLCVIGTIAGSLMGYRAGLYGLIMGAALGNIVATLPLLAITRHALR